MFVGVAHHLVDCLHDLEHLIVRDAPIAVDVVQLERPCRYNGAVRSADKVSRAEEAAQQRRCAQAPSRGLGVIESRIEKSMEAHQYS